MYQEVRFTLAVTASQLRCTWGHTVISSRCMPSAVSHLEVRGPVGGDVEDLDAGDDGEQWPEHRHPVCCLCPVSRLRTAHCTVISAQSALSAVLSAHHS